jgi:hypothetical protein
MKFSKIPTHGDDKYLGSEPSWNKEQKHTDLDMMKAFNWYNYFCNRKDAKTFMLEYLKALNRSKEEISSVSSLSDSSVSHQLGWLARMLSMGFVPSEKTKEYFAKSYRNLIKETKTVKVESKKVEQPAAPITSIQDRIRDKTNDEIGELEGYIDDFMLNDCKQKIDIVSVLKSRQYSSVVSKRICDVFIERSREIEEALSGKDEQLKEGYSNFTKPELKRFKELLDTIVSETNRMVTDNKPIRKTRKVKEKPASIVVSKMKYLKEFVELNLKSVQPEKIVGASQVWTYNTKTKLLGVYNADNAKGLTVKGSTLQNYNLETSIGKRLRKPDIVLKDLLDAGKVRIKRILPDLTTKETPLTGRMNDDTIIVRVI